MREVNKLHPKLQAIIPKLIEACRKQGIDIAITQTLRTKAEQDALYAQGRTAPGKIVTKAPYPKSLHCWGVAFDFLPLTNGKPDWAKLHLFSKVGEIGEMFGLEWGGRWTSFVDRPQFQLKGYTWQTLQRTYKTPDAFIKSWEEDGDMDKIKVIVNGKTAEGLLSKDGVSYVPTRLVSEELGALVEWNGTTKTVTIKGGK